MKYTKNTECQIKKTTKKREVITLNARYNMITQMIANRNNNKRDVHNKMLDSTAKTQQTGHKT